MSDRCTKLLHTTIITWFGNSGKSLVGFFIGRVDPRLAGIFAAFGAGCSEGLPGVVVSACLFFVLDEGGIVD